MTTETLPRRFGDYVLTAALGEDALGHEYRALPASGEQAFLRLRILDSPELSADVLIDAIEANGEVHSFLKNPAVARGVHMDAAEGIPYVAWSESNGRTLSALLAKCRKPPRKIPVEHALLIVEKVATALDHAYNTSIDGDRTLHGLVWPGFIAISDDGEIRVSGFGLAPGVMASLARPRLAREIAPYLAPEERAQGKIGKRSDIYSVGVILLELLTGQPPSAADPLAVLRGTGGNPPPPLLPEIQAVLRMTLGPEEARYASPGDLRRELGKLLFSGPYSPSTFNLAYFLNELFRDEIEAETRARGREGAGRLPGAPTAGPAGSSQSRSPVPAPATPVAEAPRPSVEPPSFAAAPAPRRRPLAWIAFPVAAAAVAGALLLSRRGSTAPAPQPARADNPPLPTATFLPEFVATPEGPTNAMTEAQFQGEVSRRLGVEVQKLKKEMQTRAPSPAARADQVPPAPQATEAAPVSGAAEASALIATPRVEAELAPPTAVPVPTRVVVREGTLVPLEEVDSPPRLSKIVKPAYPPLALRTRVGGIVVLRILVSELGAPLQIEVIRTAPAGLTEAAVEAARKWTFQPATKAGVPVRTWMVVPIPFEP